MAAHLGISSVVSTHSRPKAAGHAHLKLADFVKVSTHSRPKAAGQKRLRRRSGVMFQLTAARRRLEGLGNPALVAAMFQLTAARRRLGLAWADVFPQYVVSTHSRPKAAGSDYNANGFRTWSFNSQPPEGGWMFCPCRCWIPNQFQLTAARRRLVPPLKPLTGKACIALFR